MSSQDLLKKIIARTSKVGVVGLGYVGLPFAVEKAKAGFTVVGIDRSRERVDLVNAGRSYIPDVEQSALRQAVNSGALHATDDVSVYAELDVIVICVPTPLGENLAPDLQFVRAVAKDIAAHLRPGQLISLESTTYPGTTEEELLPLLEESGLQVNQDFFLSNSPERVDPGNERYTTKNTNKVVGGVGAESLAVAKAFYEQTIDHVVPVSSARVAEMTKVYENTYRAVNIALVNEMAQLCDRMGLDVWEVLDAAFTKPFGIQAFYPGPGVGGHCIPIDPHYLEWKAREYDFETKFIQLAGQTNRSMPDFVVAKAERILAERGRSASESSVLVVGVAYKKDLDDCRESPAIEIFKKLKQKFGRVMYSDPHVESLVDVGLDDSSVPLDEAANVDLVLIATDHSVIDYKGLVAVASCVFDTRNATKGSGSADGKVVRL